MKRLKPDHGLSATGRAKPRPQNWTVWKTDLFRWFHTELRAPLTNIGGGIELLLAPSQGLDERPRETLRLVQAENTRLGPLCRDNSLTCLHWKAATCHLPGAGSLQAVVAPLRMQLERLEKGNRLEWHIPDDLPYVSSDEQALTSILVPFAG
jgi:signal transduction histidine kinase